MQPTWEMLKELKELFNAEELKEEPIIQYSHQPISLDSVNGAILRQKIGNVVNKTFAKRLKQLREEKGWSQEKLAFELDIPKSIIANYEKDNRLPKIDELYEISDGFNVSIDYLVGRSVIKNPEQLINSYDFLNHITSAEMDELALYYKFMQERKKQIRKD